MDRLADAINKANEAAAKLLRCAESISNPTYNVVMMSGKQLTILAVSHFAGQISITVEDPALSQRMSATEVMLRQDRAYLAELHVLDSITQDPDKK
jgi:hypothetical protein